MLNKSIVTRAMQMAARLTASNVSVSFAGDSPLAGLAKVCQPELTVKGASLGIPDVDQIVENSNFLAEGEVRSAHTRTIGQHVATLTAAVRSHMDFARNVVKPLMNDYSEGLFLKLRDLPSLADFNPTLVKYDLPTILKHPAYVGDLQRRATAAATIPYRVAATYPGHDEVLKMVTVGDPEIAAGILAWINDESEEGGSSKLERIWAAVMDVPNDSGDLRRWLLTAGPANLDRVMALVVAYNIATYCDGNPPETAVIAGLEYEKFIGEAMGCIASKLLMVLEYTNALQEDGVVYITPLGKNREALVFAPVLDAYLQGGGDLGVVNAALLFPEMRVTTISDLSEKQERIRQAYAHWQSQRTHEIAADRYALTLRGTYEFTRHFLETRVGDIIGQDQNETERARFVEQRLVCAKKVIADLVRDVSAVEKPVDAWGIAVEVVAGCFFEHTCAKELFTLMSEEIARNPDLRPAEAAYFAEMRYICRYVVDQLLVQRITR